MPDVSRETLNPLPLRTASSSSITRLGSLHWKGDKSIRNIRMKEMKIQVIAVGKVFWKFCTRDDQRPTGWQTTSEWKRRDQKRGRGQEPQELVHQSCPQIHTKWSQILRIPMKSRPILPIPMRLRPFNDVKKARRNCEIQVKSNPTNPRAPDRQQRISNSGGARPVTPQVKKEF